MELFDTSGHLTDGALRIFAGGTSLDQLERLEIAEHLSCCDTCLLRSTSALSEDALLVPQHSCQLSIWKKIRMQTIRIFTSRYAAAAAAIAIMTAMWSLNVFGGMVEGANQLSQMDFNASLYLSQAAQSTSDGLRQFTSLFDFSGVPEEVRPELQGGTHS